MKKIFVSVSLLLFFCVFTFAESAEEIVSKTKNARTVKSVASASVMEIQKSGKTINILKIEQYSSEGKNGLQRTMIKFKAPANVKGTRFLIRERKDGSMDQRIFLPKLGKSRRISAESQGEEPFMGTDFSHNDISFMDRDTSLDTLSILKEEKYNGKDCFVIQALPKDKSFVYSKTLMWIEKDNYIFLKGEFYNKKNQLIKLIELSDYKDVDGIMTPYTTKLSTVNADTSTIVRIKILKYGQKIPEGVFTKKYLETGKL